MDASVFMVALNAVAPVVLVIVLGYGLKRMGFLSEAFLADGNWVVFHVCLSAMLFINMYDMDSFADINWQLIVYCIATILVIFVLGMVTAVLVTPVPARRGVIWQGTFRSNFAILGIAVAAGLGGPETSSLVAVTSSFVVPVFNVLGVIALSTFTDSAHRENHSIGKVLKNVARNPMIVGAALGMACLVLREIQRALFGEVIFSIKGQLNFLYTALKNLKSITTPLALLILGGQFTFSAVRGMFREILTATLWRLVLAPVLGIGGAWLLTRAGILNCGAGEYATLLALFGAPAAVSSAIMAAQMGCDEQLATQVVVWSSLLSVITFFAQTVLLIRLGLLAVA